LRAKDTNENGRAFGAGITCSLAKPGVESLPEGSPGSVLAVDEIGCHFGAQQIWRAWELICRVKKGPGIRAMDNDGISFQYFWQMLHR